ncbi:hypothetical protein Scep_024859 [Stephania cephalantha]|uniref:Uncharacterized protein n=1 Tax=Stephania cephalantha TaxID=152367 RepID=A0AAP0HZ01_9MAGN
MESGLRESGTVIRKSTAWLRGNPRVCYAFVLVHQGEAQPTRCRCAAESRVADGDPREVKDEAAAVVEEAKASKRRKKKGRGGGKGGTAVEEASNGGG